MSMVASSRPGEDSASAVLPGLTSLRFRTSSQLIRSPSRHQSGSQTHADAAADDPKLPGSRSVFATRAVAEAMSRSRWATL